MMENLPTDNNDKEVADKEPTREEVIARCAEYGIEREMAEYLIDNP